MNPEIIKQKTDPRKLIFWGVICLILVLSNLFNIKNSVYNFFDFTFLPFTVELKKGAFATSIFTYEVTNKSTVIQENIELRKENSKLKIESGKSIDFKDQLDRISAENNIEIISRKSLKLIPFSGTQNLFSSEPSVQLYAENPDDIQINDPVYYQSDILFGFVTAINGKNITAIPFYSPKLGFTIPVNSQRDKTQVGFVDKIDNGKIFIKNIPKDVILKNGDIWITTNLRKEVPPNLVLGKIKSIENNNLDGFQIAEIEPLFDLRFTNYLFIEN